MKIIGRRRRDSSVPPVELVEPDVDEPAVVIIDDRTHLVDRTVESVPTDVPTDDPRVEAPPNPVPSVTTPAESLSPAVEPVDARHSTGSEGEVGDEDWPAVRSEEPGTAALPPLGTAALPPPGVEAVSASLATRSEVIVGDDVEGSSPEGSSPEGSSEGSATGSVRRGRIPHEGASGPLDLSDDRSVSTFRPLPRVIAIANQKGGVGKTTTTVNLGAALAELGFRTLVIDLDPQANATTGLGIDARNFEHSMYDVIMHDTPLEDCIEATSVRNLFVAPATIDLAGVEIELVPVFSRELRLRRAVETVLEDFDFVLIDCPPSLGLITVNGLAAASEVLVPIQCEYYALEGLGQLLRNVHLVASNLNDRLEVSAIVLTMYDARTRLAVDVAAEVRQHFRSKVCNIVIPRTVRLSEAPSFGQPITVFDPSSRGAVAYRELAKEVSNGAAQRVG